MKTVKLLFVFFILFFASCSSDDNNPEPELSPEELLIGKWYMVAIAFDGNETDLEDCMLDSFYEFLTDDDILMEFIDFDCSTTGLTTGTYQYHEADEQFQVPTGIEISGSAGQNWYSSYEILKVDETELILRTSSGSNPVVTFFYQRD